ncbi:MAG: RAD55 family ATPase [Promethearchaeota archaeon]
MSFRSSTQLEPCRFGIPPLDEILGGGVPRGSVLLLEDEVGIESEPIIIQFLSNGLRAGEYGYILSTEHPYSHYRHLLIPFGIDEVQLEMKRLIFLDGFSNPFGYTDIRTDVENVVRDISQPRQIIDSIRRSILHVRTAQVRGVIDSLTTLLLVSDSLKPALSFLQTKIAQDKQRNFVSLLTLHTDVHEPHIIRAIEHHCDGVIRIEKPDPNSERPDAGTLSVRKMIGVSLGSLTTQFWYKFSPGSVELIPKTEDALEGII